jgi:hypothetical protein
MDSLLSDGAVKAVLIFSSSYLCEVGFSSLVAIKNQNILDVSSSLRP